MTDNEIITLNQLLSTGAELSAKELKKAESQKNIARIKEIIKKQVKAQWPVACGFILKKLMEALDPKVSDVLVAVWGKYKDIVKFTDKQEYPPDKKYLVALAEHTIESTHTPIVEILFNNQKVDEIKFEIQIYLTVAGINLEIQDGKIMKVYTGSCKGGGSIKCEDFQIFKKETSSFTLPGSISLGQGIAIPKII